MYELVRAPLTAQWNRDGVNVKGNRNPRQDAGRARKKAARRYAAMNAPCALCRGALGDIRYDQPRTHNYPLSLAIDEIAPVSRWQEFGYSSARECACDPNNWQPAHWICNAQASDKRKPPKLGIMRRKDRNSGTF